MGSKDSTGRPFDLGDQLTTCIQEFEEERQAYWKKRRESGDWGPDGLYGRAERMAAALLGGIEQLALPESAGRESETFTEEYVAFFKKIVDLRELWRSNLGVNTVPPIVEDLIESVGEEDRPPKDTLLALVWERFFISLAIDVVDIRLLRGTNRMMRLITLTKKAAPDSVTLRYLQRVSTCYILGLDAECAILCRAAIDSALGKALPKPESDFNLARRIQAAADMKPPVLDEKGRKAAHRVNNAAKESVHVDSLRAKGMLTVIKDMLEVVGQATPSK